MRRKIYTLLLILVFVLFISIFIEPIIISLAKHQLSKTFINSEVTIGGCNFSPFSLLTLSEIEIKKKPIYDFKVKKASFLYNIRSIIKGNILKVSLKDAILTVNLPESSISDIIKHRKPGGKDLFLVTSLELSNLNLDLKYSDLVLEANISSELSMINQLINYFDLKVDFLESKGLQLENASLKVSQDLPSGLLFIERIKHDKFRIEKIESIARLKDKFLFLDSLSAELLGGNVQGNLSFKIDKSVEYFINLKFIDLDLKTFVDDFNLKEKVQVDGRFSGLLSLEANGLNINVLNGDFSATGSGGVLTIKDNEYLKRIASSSNQSLNIVMESFKNYHYNTGMMKLYLDNGNLVLDVALKGEAGKRNVAIVLHDFK